MSIKSIDIKWEWPATRSVESKMLVKIEKIDKASKGFFGIGASPSLAAALPDATDVLASVVSGPTHFVGKLLALQLPGMEAAKLKVGERAAIGLIENNTISICLAAVPADTADMATWLANWNCK